VAEARRVLAPGGTLLVVDLAPHDRADLRERMAHRALGFSDTDMNNLLQQSGLHAASSLTVPGALPVRIWASRAGARISTDHFEVAQ
jgi:ArsR family transcriptional regulator